MTELYHNEQLKFTHPDFPTSKFNIVHVTKNTLEADLIINTTPIGMQNKNILPKKILKKQEHRYIIDLTINNKNKLSKIAKKLEINYVSGLEISLYQGLEQFKIYTNKIIKLEKIKKQLNFKF